MADHHQQAAIADSSAGHVATDNPRVERRRRYSFDQPCEAEGTLRVVGRGRGGVTSSLFKVGRGVVEVQVGFQG